MWLFTKHGFFSAVCARQGDGSHGKPVDSNRIMVRARVKKHLESLQARFAEQLADCEIVGTPNTDYAWRLFVPKNYWSQVLAGLGDEVDYDNFKSAVAQHPGQDGAAYESTLHEVWGVMNKLQKKGER